MLQIHCSIIQIQIKNNEITNCNKMVTESLAYYIDRNRRLFCRFRHHASIASSQKLYVPRKTDRPEEIRSGRFYIIWGDYLLAFFLTSAVRKLTSSLSPLMGTLPSLTKLIPAWLSSVYASQRGIRVPSASGPLGSPVLMKLHQ